MASSSHNSGSPQLEGGDAPAAVDWVRRTGQADAFLSTLDRQLKRRRRRRWVQAAGATMALAVAGFVWTALAPQGPRLAPGSPVFALGAAAKQVLVDGSEVDLNDGADLAVNFSPESRRVALQRGMAHFRVAKSPVPFVVVAGEVEVRAVGTAFATKLDSNGDVEVVVTEGVVAIDQPVPKDGRSTEAAPFTQSSSYSGPGRSARTMALLRAGHRLIIAKGESQKNLENRIATLSADEMSKHLDWRVPQLRFNGTPLAEAVPMFNRHSKIQLRLADDTVGAVKVSGTLRGDNVAPLVRMLELEHGLKADREGDTIILSAAREPGR